MKLFEYMGKQILAAYGIRTPRGKMVVSPDEAAAVARELGGEVVVKSQILSGKRGKGGGIKFAGSPEEAAQAAAQILGTQVQGYTVEMLLVEEKLDIDSEFYVAITIDGAARKPVLIASTRGGMDIEEVPEEDIVKQHIDVNYGIQPYLAREISRRLNLSGSIYKEFNALLPRLYQIFREKDAELVEINPLVVSGESLIAADAKVTIDDEALFRQKDIPYVEERTEAERKAHALGLSYVQLDGNIAVMANGAGITMGTLDIIQHYGGAPANFLDAGGGTGKEATAKALEILLSTNPKVILINIFGGITRCDDVASALVQVKKEIGIPVPVVIRLVGTNEEIGVRILKENGFEAYRVMHEAAAKAVELARD
ncbi:MAG: ADP-forming succinate--CoA ligase subunit beta [Desulfurispora sp.]|uniref:ADP-forming succinate--CoA ligase subunit beta n=1 Tax=Desulfurispora sp. TaxID=3014275 RepID=UPI00404937DD